MTALRRRLIILIPCVILVMLTTTHPPSQQVTIRAVSLKGSQPSLADWRVSQSTTTTTAPTTTTTAPDPTTTTSTVPARKHRTTTTTTPSQEETPDTVSESAGESGDVVALIHEIFGSAGDKATRVAKCESGLDPSQVSKGGGNWGLFQINTAHAGSPDEDPGGFEAVTGLPFRNGTLNARANAIYAKHLYDSEGWGPWSCRGA